MTNFDQPGGNTAPLQDCAANVNADEQRRQSVFAENRATLFDALERSGITLVTVVFDGCGDSGQIEDIGVMADTAVDLKAIKLDQKRVRWGDGTIETVTADLETTIEDLAYAFLEQAHGSWGDNEGAYGEFVFDVAERTIVLDFNERYLRTESYWHEF